MSSVMKNDVQEKVFQTLVGFDKPVGNKELAKAAGLDGKEVTKAIKELKSKGLVDSPVRCKYAAIQTGASKPSTLET